MELRNCLEGDIVLTVFNNSIEDTALDTGGLQLEGVQVAFILQFLLQHIVQLQGIGPSKRRWSKDCKGNLTFVCGDDTTCRVDHLREVSRADVDSGPALSTKMGVLMEDTGISNVAEAGVDHIAAQFNLVRTRQIMTSVCQNLQRVSSIPREERPR